MSSAVKVFVTTPRGQSLQFSTMSKAAEWIGSKVNRKKSTVNERLSWRKTKYHGYKIEYQE